MIRPRHRVGIWAELQPFVWAWLISVAAVAIGLWMLTLGEELVLALLLIGFFGPFGVVMPLLLTGLRFLLARRARHNEQRPGFLSDDQIDAIMTETVNAVLDWTKLRWVGAAGGFLGGGPAGVAGGLAASGSAAKAPGAAVAAVTALDHQGAAIPVTDHAEALRRFTAFFGSGLVHQERRTGTTYFVATASQGFYGSNPVVVEAFVRRTSVEVAVHANEGLTFQHMGQKVLRRVRSLLAAGDDQQGPIQTLDAGWTGWTTRSWQAWLVIGGVLIGIPLLFTVAALTDLELRGSRSLVGRLTQPLSSDTVDPSSQRQAGVIEGSLSYPSHSIPAELVVCAESLATGAQYCTDDHLAGDQYTFGTGYSLVVPAGEYHVAATLPSQPDLVGSYSELVTCGLRIECQSHALIVVRVGAGEQVRNIDPGDWYAAADASQEAP